jgi:acetolactate synthase-1/2/3 large subunit
MASASELLSEILIEAGIDHVFGMPGGGTPPLWDALHDNPDIRPVLARHEGGAACMADMYGRITGKPGVLMGQGLWIGTNGGFGIVEAFLAGVPMLVITDVSDYNSLGQFGPYQAATGEFGAVDLPAMMRGMTKFTTVATNLSELVHGAQLAIKHAMTGRPGPTCLLVRMGAAVSSSEPEDIRPRLYPLAGYVNASPACISNEDAARIGDMLLGAEEPLMIAGAGVHRSQAYQEVQDLAELLGMPVTTSYMGKSAIAETHDLSLGTMGVIGQKIANQRIASADVILAVGTCLAPDNTKMISSRFINPERQRIIHIDIEPLHTGWTYPIAVGVASDAKLALRAICGAIQAKAPDLDVTNRTAKLKEQKAEATFFEEEPLFSDEIPIAPERVVKELNEVVSPEDLIVLDAGNNRMWMAHHFKTKKAGQMFAAGGAAGVGYGVPAALTTQMIRPDNKVVCVAGDGGMMMHLYTLEMAKEYRLPLTYVIMNNACLGNVMDYQPFDRRVATRYERVDFAKIASGFGVQSVRIDKPEELGAAIKNAMETQAPVLVDVAIADYPHFRLRPET